MVLVNPVARSAVSAFSAVDEMIEPVTTGWPTLLIRNVPVPLKLIVASYFLAWRSTMETTAAATIRAKIIKMIMG